MCSKRLQDYDTGSAVYAIEMREQISESGAHVVLLYLYMTFHENKTC